jgi:hypothetical protein
MHVDVNGTRLWFDDHFPWLDRPDEYFSVLSDFITAIGATRNDDR